MIDSSHSKIAAGKRRLLLALGLVCLGGAASVANAAETLRFRVFLDQDPIGEHSFQVLPDAGGKRVLSRASFDVRLLVFNAYRYRHESREEWRDGCLERIEATTDDNGKDYRVEGTRERSALAVRINGDAKQLPQCVSTFAYWNRDFLKQGRLLNPQTGELVSVRVEPAGRERRVAQGRELEAERYRLQADGMDIDLWYTPDGRWIGLESDTGKGRTLRYERI